MADSSGAPTEKPEKAEKKEGPSGKKEILQSERPKRDAAKKFIDDVGTGKLDGRKSLSEAAARAPGPARKAAAKGQDGAKRPVGTGAPRKPQAVHHSDVPKVSVDTGIRRLDLAALKRCATIAWHAMIALLSCACRDAIDGAFGQRARLLMGTKCRYKKHFNLKNTTSSNKDDLQAHFADRCMTYAHVGGTGG